MEVEFSLNEVAAIQDLSAELHLSQQQIVRQAVTIYKVWRDAGSPNFVLDGEADGETKQ